MLRDQKDSRVYIGSDRRSNKNANTAGSPPVGALKVLLSEHEGSELALCALFAGSVRLFLLST